MSYNIILDDTRTIEQIYAITHNSIYIDEEWYIVKNTPEFIEKIKKSNKLPDRISFDHDLGLDDDGAIAARELIDYCLTWDIPLTCEIFIHSQNFVGRERIASIFKSYFKFLSLIKYYGDTQFF